MYKEQVTLHVQVTDVCLKKIGGPTNILQDRMESLH